jgi:hypothetical protein
MSTITLGTGIDHHGRSVVAGLIVMCSIKFTGRHTPVAATALDDEQLYGLILY